MKRTIIIILLLVSIRASAPTAYPCFYLVNPVRTDYYDDIKFAVGMVECKLDTLAVNPVEQAYGYFQVRQVRLDDYCKRTGIRYSLKDMLDYAKAESVFMYYARRIGWDNPDKIARSWNGSGPKTWDYWNKVKIYLII